MHWSTLFLPMALFAPGIVQAQPEALPIPKIDILYPAPNGSIFDVGCADLLKVTVPRESVEQAMARAPELQELWNRDGPTYLSTTFAEIGLPFPYREMQATLTVCPGVRSMSSPLFVNVTRFLPSAAKRYPDWYFVEILYHELMHNYVQRVRTVSALRKKYAAEPTVTLSHLPVMALEKTVLLKMGKTEELKRVGAEYLASPAPAYKRAWTIVNDIEGAEPFIRELKQLARPAAHP